MADLSEKWKSYLQEGFSQPPISSRHRMLLPRRNKEKVAVVTDSSSCLPSEISQADRYRNVRIVSIPVMIGEQIYVGRQHDLSNDLALALAQGKVVRTSRPSPGDFAEVYESLHREGFTSVVSIHLSSKLSSSMEAASMAARESPIPVTVLDSLQTGLALGQAVLDAAGVGRAGMSHQVVCETAQSTCDASRSFLIVPHIEQLRRSGRVSSLGGLLGELFQVKPVLYVEHGEVLPLERHRSFDRAYNSLLTLVEETASAMESPRLGVHGFGNPEQVDGLCQELRSLNDPVMPIIGVELPAGLAAHMGLGALAVSLSPAPQLAL